MLVVPSGERIRGAHPGGSIRRGADPRSGCIGARAATGDGRDRETHGNERLRASEDEWHRETSGIERQSGSLKG
jgi:hypothetical protein